MDYTVSGDLTDTEIICPVCNAEFLDSDDLNIHMQEHSPTQKFPKPLSENNNNFCNICGLIFTDMEFYALHLINTHIVAAVVCKYCSRVFFDRSRAEQHELEHRGSALAPLISCSQCEEVFHCIEELEDHESIAHYPNEGLMLQKYFPMLSSLIHMNIRHFLKASTDYDSFKCIYCKMCTRDIVKYLEHLETENLKSLTCNKCCEVFFFKQGLMKHMLKTPSCRNQLTTETCRKCGQEFDRILLKEHRKYCKETPAPNKNVNLEDGMLAHGSNSLPMVSCRFCQKPFTEPALTKHIERTHKATLHLYKYRCTYCDVVFKHPKFLFGHYFSQHKHLEPYTCKICDKKFKIRKNFTLHIKLTHKSVGFVEFADNYHVFFTDKKSEKPFRPRAEFTDDYDMRKHTCHSIKFTKINKDENVESSNVDEGQTEKNKSDKAPDETEDDIDMENHANLDKIEPNTVYIVNMNSDFMETDGNQTEVETKKNSRKKRKRKTKSKLKRSKKQSKIRKWEEDETMLSSDDSNMPLLNVKKIAKSKHIMSILSLNKKGRKKKGKFMCPVCRKDCYTYQNYHRHIGLHKKSKGIECMKCSELFSSRSQLNDHIKSNHSSSRLTDYLKQLIERRKNKILQPKDRKSIVEGLRNTIKKVEIQRSESAATLTRVDDRISVKNFLENFTPDNEGQLKDITVENSLSIKMSPNVQRESVIKLTKFYLENTPLKLKPKMPVKFKDDFSAETYKVSIKLCQEQVAKPNLKLNQPTEQVDTYTDQDNNVNENEFDDRDIVPEVAEEVMLNTDETPSTEQPRGTVIIENLPEIYSKVRIAHLQPEAPFYKIVTIDEAIKKKKAQVVSPENKITLPDGTKLVNVNPLAHLLGDQDISEILKKKSYYKEKLKDIKVAIAKSLDSNPAKKRKNANDEF